MTMELQHDEINLFRLVRRLEKSAQLSNKVELEDEDTRRRIWAQCQKEIQKVKYARKLLKKIQGCESTSDHTRRLSALKSTLESLESSLDETQATCKPIPIRPPSLLSQLPPPREEAVPPSPSVVSPAVDHLGEGAEDLADGQTTPKASSSSTAHLPPHLPISGGPVDNFLLAPPDTFPGLPSSGLVSALPALTSPPAYSFAYNDANSRDTPPLGPATSSTTSISGPSSSGGLFSRRKASSGPNKEETSSSLSSNEKSQTHAHLASHTALQTSLQTTLAQMSAQLKQNALHFQNLLQADAAIVQTASEKVDENLGFMTAQRVRIKEFAGRTKGSTLRTLGIILIVLLVFMGMVMFIRATRIIN